MRANKMKMIAITTLTLGLAATAASAASPNDGTRALQLHQPTAFAGSMIPPGAYTLSWSREHGSDAVKVSIARGRHVVASGLGHWVEANEPSPFEATVSHPANGNEALFEIRFLQSVDAIRIDANPDTAQSGAGTGTVSR